MTERPDDARAYIILSAIIFIAAALTGGYYLGKHQGFAQGYKKGHEIGKNEAPPIKTYFAEYMNLQGDYDKLVGDYNNLVDEAQRYINVARYRALQPITCNTQNFNMLNSSTTRCY